MWRRRLIVLMGFGVLLVGPVSAQAGELPDGSNVVATATSAADDPVGTVTSTANDGSERQTRRNGHDERR